MANIFTNFLDSAAGDLKDTNLKDYRHANRLFVQNFYRLAPKHGFLYFVRFRLNPKVADGEVWRSSKQDLELGMLVKKCDLPKITFDGTTLNVYNKKQPVYTKLNYQPINMVLHDDNKGLAREFWQMYYQYHSSDSYYGGNNAEPGILPINPKNRYEQPGRVTSDQLRNRSNPNSDLFVTTTDPAKYGLDAQTPEPMIRSIEIYQLSRKQFFLHTLINPKIRTWNMDTVASDAKNLMEHNVVIEYEGVYMGQGKVTRFSPDGWTDLHYDLEPSPIGGIFGRSDGGLLGPNGLIADGTTLFAELEDFRNTDNPSAQQGLSLLLRSVRLIGNAANLNTDLARQQITNEAVQNISFGVAGVATGGSVNGLSVSRPNDTFSFTNAVGRNDITPSRTQPVLQTQIATNNGAFAVPDARTTTSVSIQPASTSLSSVSQVNLDVANSYVSAIVQGIINDSDQVTNYYNSLTSGEKTNLQKLSASTYTQAIANGQSVDSARFIAYSVMLGGIIASEVRKNPNNYTTSDSSNLLVNNAIGYIRSTTDLSLTYNKFTEEKKQDSYVVASKAANQILVEQQQDAQAASVSADVIARMVLIYDLVSFSAGN
jgi:hypothetical protein